MIEQNRDFLEKERNKDPCLFYSVPDGHKEINDSLHLSHPKQSKYNSKNENQKNYSADNRKWGIRPKYIIQ